LSGEEVQPTGDIRVVPLPSRYPDPIESWHINSSLPVDHIASGSFETAMEILNAEYGIVNFEPMKDIFMNIYRSNSSLFFGLNSTSTLTLPLCRNWREKGIQYPKLLHSFGDLIESVQNSYREVTDGRFTTAIEILQNVFVILPLIPIESKENNEEKNEIIKICRDYILGILIELTRKELLNSDGPTERIVELSLYFTHCDFQHTHQYLAIKQAMRLCASKKVYATAYNLASKFLEFELTEEDEQTAQKILKHCEQKGRTNTININYDEKESICHMCTIIHTHLLWTRKKYNANIVNLLITQKTKEKYV